MLASLALTAILLAQNPATCSGPDLAITSVTVAGVTPSGGNNVYHLRGTVTNLGHARQPSNALQFVDIFYRGDKLDSRGVPPLAPGQHYTFGYDFQRSADANAGTSALRFTLDFRQPAGAQDCNTANDTFRLTF